MNEIQENHYVVVEKANMMKFEDEGFESGDVVYRDVKWRLRICLGRIHRLKVWRISVLTDTELQHSFWSILANFKLKILKKDGTYYSEDFNAFIDRTSILEEFPNKIEYDVFAKNDSEYLINGVVRFELHVGIQKAVFLEDFTVGNELSDVVFVVEEQKLYLNKYILATNSPVFERMLFGHFAEAYQNEIVIKDVTYENFVEFMYFVYRYCDDLNANNFDNILTLADKFDVKTLKQKCYDFLISNNSQSLTAKLQYLKKFDSFAQNYCIQFVEENNNANILQATVSTEKSIKDEIMNKLVELDEKDPDPHPRRTRLRIELEVKNVSKLTESGVLSNITNFCNLDWQINIGRTKDGEYMYFNAIVRSDMSRFNGYFDASFRFQLLRMNEDPHMMNYNCYVDSSFKTCVNSSFILWENFTKPGVFITDDKAKFLLEIGVYAADYSFIPSDKFSAGSNLADVVLQVNDTQLHVNRNILSIYSSAIKCIFSENPHNQEFVIENVETEEFIIFLGMLYGYIHKAKEDTYKYLLQLAKRFDVPIVTRECENFLLESEFSLPKKFEIADKFLLHRLKYQCIKGVKSIGEIKELHRSYYTFRESTKEDLMRRAAEFTKTAPDLV